MRRIFFFLGLLCQAFFAFPQKQPISFDLLDKWPVIGTKALISNDGKFCCYTVINQKPNSKEFYLKSLNDSWEKRIFTNGMVSFFSFTSDSKYAFVIVGGDSLAMVKLGTQETTFIDKISSYSCPENDFGEW